MSTSKTGSAHKYIDTAHRASLMYSFAALLLKEFSSYNEYSEDANFYACFFPLLFFGFAISTYLLHGLLEDTSNQISKPRLGRTVLPVWVTPMFMSALVVAEIGGFVVLLFGFVHAYF
jgi:hypothetical protein